MSEQSNEDRSFKLSRIYAQGWNAAKELLSSGNGDSNALQAAERNPHRETEERARWLKGFMEGLESPTGRSPRQPETSRTAVINSKSGRPVGARRRK